ncbi:hypothetical protein ACWGJB_32810 [Streptomyces sp. NPDC054813]
MTGRQEPYYVDFGLSHLAGTAHQDWSGSREEIHSAADSDSIGQTPGSAAAVLLEDTLRLLRGAAGGGRTRVPPT